MITRKLRDAKAKEVLEERMEDAMAYGHSFIELRLKNADKNKSSLIGRESFNITTSRRAGDMFSTTSGVKIITDGTIVFYPDSRNICWGYMLDTEKNRLWLAAQLVSPAVLIVDQKIKGEIIELAKKKGYAIVAVAKDKSLDNYLKKSEPKKAELDLKDELERLREELATLKASEEAKPLAGKKITKKKSE